MGRKRIGIVEKYVYLGVAVDSKGNFKGWKVERENKAKRAWWEGWKMEIEGQGVTTVAVWNYLQPMKHIP